MGGGGLADHLIPIYSISKPILIGEPDHEKNRQKRQDASSLRHSRFLTCDPCHITSGHFPYILCKTYIIHFM